MFGNNIDFNTELYKNSNEMNFEIMNSQNSQTLSTQFSTSSNKENP